MDKKLPLPNDDPQLVAFRQAIDALDDKIIALMVERINVVARVGELKRKAMPGVCPIRPAREAEMVRRVMQKFAGTLFPSSAAAAIWRLLIGASTSVESQLTISAYTPEREGDLYWLAREYFGPFLQVIRQPLVKRVIGDVMDGKAAVGIVPTLKYADGTYWWTNLMEPGQHIPKIFARVPFVENGSMVRDAPAAFAIGRVTPEASGDDISLLVIEADHHVSQHRLQTAIANAKLEASWINVATLTPDRRHHLLEIKGFVTPEHPAIQSLRQALSNAITRIYFLGAYAVPVTPPKTVATERKPHHAEPAKT